MLIANRVDVNTSGRMLSRVDYVKGCGALTERWVIRVGSTEERAKK